MHETHGKVFIHPARRWCKLISDSVSGLLVPFGDMATGAERPVGDIDRLYSALLTENDYSVAAGANLLQKRDAEMPPLSRQS